MSQPSTPTTYATAFLASISLFGLVDAARVTGELTVAAPAATAVTRAFLLPVLGIASVTFLALTIITLSRQWLRRPQGWNSDRTESRVLVLGLTTTAYFGVLALLGYVFTLIAPGWAGGLAGAMTRHWPWLLALPCLIIGATTHRNKPAWLVAGAVFVTMGLFTG